MAHIRQSAPDSGFGFQVTIVHTFEDVPSALGNALSSSGGRAWSMVRGPVHLRTTTS